MSSSPDGPTVVGRELPGTVARVDPVIDWLLRDVVAAPAAPRDDDVAHPTAAFALAQDGLDLRWDELLALLDADAEDGPMLASWSAVYRRPLRTGLDYRVRGRIDALERKHGAATGPFDLASVVVDVLGPDHEPHVEVRYDLVLPRSGPTASTS